MTISIIAAVAENGVIGYRNRLPWRLPADLRHFRSLTLGKPVIMGRNTFESLGRPLPDRQNIVLTGRSDYSAPGCLIAHSVRDALEACAPAPEVMVIGGGNVYLEFLPLADRMYLTLVHGRFEGDARFPAYDRQEWVERERSDFSPDQDHAFAYSFVTLTRCRPHAGGS